jgi:predicted NACHT family NTPase
MLKNEIFKGNCILLLDGLDEVPSFEDRHKVVYRIQEFIEQFSLSSNFTSPFDNGRQLASLWHSTNYSEPSCQSYGNQVVVTSQFAAYDATPLNGYGICHYSLPQLKIQEMDKFIDEWFISIECSIRQVLDRHGLNSSYDTTGSAQYSKNLKTAIVSQTHLRTAATNPRMLAMLCTWSLRCDGTLLHAPRIHLYEEAVAVILRH